MLITIFNEDVILCGDLFFRLVNARNGQIICRFALNTSFIGNDNIYELNKKGVDPDSIGKDKRFDPHFKIELVFEDVCDQCKPEDDLESICGNCLKNNYMKEEIKEWK